MTELRRGTSVGVTPWHRRRAARRPWRGYVRGGGGGAAGLGEGGRKGKGVWPGGLARPAGPLGAKRPDGCWAVWDKSWRKNNFGIKIGF
jgi:hypothetical protein